MEIQREDDGGLGGEFTSGWEALDRKNLIHDENTPQPMQFEYVDWRQIKASWKYGWRMRFKGNNNLYSAWSDTITATVVEDTTAPDVPTIVVTPLDLKFLIIMSAPTQGGNVCRSFSHFQVQGYEQSAGEWVDVDAHAKAIIVYQGLTPANMGQTWKHRVRAWNTSQRYSAWSTETSYQQVLKIGTSSLNTAVNSVLSQVSTNTGNISTHATLIQQNADAIVLRALSTSLDTTNGRVTTCESNISTNASNINLRVQKNDVINQINISTEETTISGGRFHVTSSTQFDSDVAIQGILKASGGLKTSTGTERIELGNIAGNDRLSVYIDNVERGVLASDGNNCNLIIISKNAKFKIAQHHRIVTMYYAADAVNYVTNLVIQVGITGGGEFVAYDAAGTNYAKLASDGLHIGALTVLTGRMTAQTDIAGVIAQLKAVGLMAA